jgi:hypothetical protein
MTWASGSKVQRWTRVLAAVLILVLGTGGALAAGPGITPATVEELVFPGESVTIPKTVTTPEILPKPDIYFLADNTGSMGAAIANVQANASDILNSVKTTTNAPRFGAGAYQDFPTIAPTLYAFKNQAPIPATDDSGAAALAAIAAWNAVPGSGGDEAEGQFFALDQLAGGAASWRADSSKIVVWFGDSAGHDPICSAISGLPNDISEASLTAKLVAAKIRVIAIGVVGTGSPIPGGLDGDPSSYSSFYTGLCPVIDGAAGQATRLANATGGVYLSGVTPDQVSDAILAGLAALPVDVSMASDCTAPISTTFSPASQNVTSGQNATFSEKISVAAGASGGTYTCKDRALLNGEPMTDAAGNVIYETKTIDVPGIDLKPATATNEVKPGAKHTVVATVTAGGAGPVAGVRIQFSIVSGPHKGVTGTGTTDALGQASFSYSLGLSVSPADLGTDTIQAVFTNADGTVAYGRVIATKKWVDTTPPTAACVPSVNPAGKHEPNAPGGGGQGKNQDGFYQATAHDVVWPDSAIKIYVTDTGSGTVFGPYDDGVRIKYTQDLDATPEAKLIGGPDSAVQWHIIGTGDAAITAVDGSGNVSAPAACLVPPPPM